MNTILENVIELFKYKLVYIVNTGDPVVDNLFKINFNVIFSFNN